MIRKGSTVAYVSYDRGHKTAGIGKVVEIDKVNDTCVVMDCWQFYTCNITECENTCNW